MTQIDFLFDFGSPNAYLSHKVIPGIEARTGAKFTYVPTLLGGLFKLTGNQSPMSVAPARGLASGRSARTEANSARVRGAMKWSTRG